MAKRDLSNQKFGELTAIYPTEKRRDGCVVWKCVCDCGNDCEALSKDLRSGHKRSCGHLKKFNGWGANRINLTNQKFGKLTALFPTEERDSHQNVKWHCICECGNTKNVGTTNLVNGNVKSCGCLGSSYGEYLIENLLKQNNVIYEKEKIFTDFVYEDSKLHPRYDFYLPEYNRLIEYDGEIHYGLNISGWNTNEKVLLTQKHDLIKNNYANEHLIDLVRIPYFEKDNITLDMLLGNKYLINK